MGSLTDVERSRFGHGFEGGRLVLSQLPTPTILEMATVIHGLRIAPWPRLVADLRQSDVRGEEAAEQAKEVFRDG